MNQELSQIIKKLARNEDSHKGNFGNILFIGGDFNMGGAIILSASAAMKSGAGKASVLTRNIHIPALLSFSPNLMYYLEDEKFENIIKDKDLITIGPGLGQSKWSKKLFKKALNSDLTKVIDADGLNLLAQTNKKINLKNSVLTPHVGEAARLLNTTNQEILKNLEISAQKLHDRYKATIILKSSESIICDENNLKTISIKNPALATAGTGDLLTGIVSGLISQKLSNFEASYLASYIHKLIPNIEEKNNQLGVTSPEMLNNITNVINQKLKNAMQQPQ